MLPYLTVPSFNTVSAFWNSKTSYFDSRNSYNILRGAWRKFLNKISMHLGIKGDLETGTDKLAKWTIIPHRTESKKLSSQRLFIQPTWVVVTWPDSSIGSKQSKNKNPVSKSSIPLLGVKLKRRWYVFCLFSQMYLCSASSFKRSQRGLSIDVAEHRSFLKITKIRTTPVVVSHPKQV